MGSVTCGDGRSVLPTSVGSSNPAEARGGAAVSCGCWRRSARVAGVARNLRSELIALTPSLLSFEENGSNWLFSPLLQMWLSQGFDGSLWASWRAKDGGGDA